MATASAERMNCMRLNRRDNRLCLLVGFALSTGMMLCLFLFTDVHFAVNDDKTILRAFAGYQPGGAVDFHLYIHPILAYPLCWLGNAFPGVAWYSGMLVLFQWFANGVIAKSILRSFRMAGRSLWLGGLLAAVCLIAFGMVYSFEITYTATAAFLGAAAVAQLMAVDLHERLIPSAGLSLLLVALAYGLRQMTALPILAYCALAMGLLALRCLGVDGHPRRSLKPLGLVVLCVVVAMGLLAGGRELELTLKNKRDYLAWQQARIRVMDYVDLNQVDDSVYESIGWKPSEVAMVNRWYLADENITTQAFDAIAESQAAPSALGDARTRLLRFAQTDRLGVRAFQVLAALGVACLVWLAMKRKRRLLPLIGVLAAGVLCMGMVLYLALSGRVLMRGLLLAAYPAAACLCCLAPYCLPQGGEKSRLRQVVAIAAGLLVLLAALRYAVPAREYMAQTTYLKSIPVQMDAVALSHPDKLFFFDIDCGNDLRLIPDTSGGVPHNLVSLGTWERGGDAYVRQLAAFGLDSEALHASDFLNDNVRIISTQPEPSETFMAYLSDYAGTPVTAQQEQVTGELYIYRYMSAEP